MLLNSLQKIQNLVFLAALKTNLWNCEYATRDPAFPKISGSRYSSALARLKIKAKQALGWGWQFAV